LLKSSVGHDGDESVRPEHPEVVVVSQSMLMNRVDREARVVAQSFDAISSEAVAHLEVMYGRVAALLYVGLKSAKASGDDLRHTCAIVLTNALTVNRLLQHSRSCEQVGGFSRTSVSETGWKLQV